jgi:predicted permease
VGLLGRARKSIIRSLRAFNDFMTAPLWASLASIVVAFIPPLQHWLQTSARPLSGALTSAGNCSIPLTLVVLGAYFYPEVPESPKIGLVPPSMLTASPSTSTLVGDLNVESSGSSRKKAARKGESMTVVISILSRMILTPLVLMPLIVSAAKYDFQAILEEYVFLIEIPYILALTNSCLKNSPVFVVTNVLLLASPPAVTLAQITQAASGDSFERLISRTIFWSYCVFTPPTVILFVLLGLVLSKM